MSDLSPSAREALWAWPYIQEHGSSVSHDVEGVLSSQDWPLDVTRHAGSSTSSLWDVIKAAAPDEAAFRSLRFAAGLSTLRGMHNAAVNAQAALGRAQPEWTLGSDMIATAPYARSLAERNTLGRWQVRVPITGRTRAGAELTKTITVMYQGALPATVGELVDDATGSAVNKSIASDFEPLGSGIPSILAV